MTFALEADLVNPDANVLSMPSAPVSVISLTPVTPDIAFFGTHVGGYPPNPLQGYSCSAVRSHDYRWTRWQTIETADGVYDWSRADEWVNTYHAQGKLLVWVLFGTPAWASARPGEASAYGINGMAAEPANMNDWADFCTVVATRYAGKISHFEVWNEPNLTGFYTGTAAKLSEMVRRAAQAIKAVIPSAKILSPAVTGWATTAAQSAETYFNSMMAASDGASGTMVNWVDVVAVHLYVSGNSMRTLPARIDRVRAAMTTSGVSALPLWDTESAPIGPDAASISTQAEIEWMERAYATMLLKGVARSFYYTFDHSTMGVEANAQVRASREDFIRRVCSGSLQSGTFLWDGRIAYYLGGNAKVV